MQMDLCDDNPGSEKGDVVPSTSTDLVPVTPAPTPLVPVVVVEEPLDRNPAAVYLARLAPSSRRVMKSALDRITVMLSGDPTTDASNFPWSVIRYQHAAAVRAKLAERFAPATANQHLSALRGVLQECWRLGLVDAETYRRAADVEPVKGTTLPAGRQISQGELRALFGSCAEDGNALGARDAALMAILFGAGLRRSEAVGLDLADYDRETGALTVKRGKGNKARLCYVTNGAADAIDSWISIRGSEPGPLLVAVNKGGKLGTRRLTPQSVFDALRRRGQKAGVPEFSPHDFRRSFVSELLDAGADIATVQKLAGHASVTTTARYDRRGEGVKRKAVELIHVPFVGK